MEVRNGVAYRRAGPGEMMLKPPAWSFHEPVLQQMEAAQVVHIEVTNMATGHVYRVPWQTFAAMAVETNRGQGAQRYLPLQYWSIDGQAPERQPAAKPPQWVQADLFGGAL